MKDVFYIDDTPANKISYYFMLVFLVSLPFDRIYSELALIGLLLHTVIHLNRREQENLHPLREQASLHPRRKPENLQPWRGRINLAWPGWLIASLYLLTMAGTLWSDHRGLAFKEWEKQLALLLFPLIFYFTQLDWKKYQPPLLKAFAVSCLFTTLYLYGIAFGHLRDQSLPISALFSPACMNHSFSAPIDLHATYFSMYIGISLVTFIQLMVQTSRPLGRWLYALASFILLAAILQLAARSVCIALLIIVNGLLPFWLMKYKARRIFIPVVIGITLLSFIAIVNNDNLHARYLVQLRQDLKGDIGDINGPEPRMARWLCAWELIRDSPWIGYGTGTEVNLLKEKYTTHQLYGSYAHDLNAHNQYLSFLLKTGIFSALLYLGVLVIGFLQAYRLKDPFLGSFLIMVVCVSACENLLDVNKGIFFFSFFFSFFLSRPDSIFVFHYGNKNTLPLMGT
jgi:O-antigen ligase